ncbi:hypothetical protein [Halomonas salina]|uniref:Uncharacterized protein n=1 Tax=Halomonas salina TaxID=42565 RepID=A0ABR4WSH0_9GAMM|nr:hypothetical protein [Halomonas salina]KGE77671.1 hypothetical protein FP66_08585 [Halomonas salina]
MNTPSNIQPRTSYAVIGEPANAQGTNIGLLMGRDGDDGLREHALYDLSLEQAKRLASELQNTIWATEMMAASRRGGVA